MFNAVTDAQFTITAALGVNETVPLYESVVHSLPTWLCGPTAADADEVVECLEKWDNAANDSTSKRIRWGIDAEGRMFCSRRAASVRPTQSRGRARRFGACSGSRGRGRGHERRRHHAHVDLPAAGVLILRNGMAAGVPSRMNDGSAFRLQGGTVAGRLAASWREFEVQAILDGAVGYAPANAAYADEVEQYLHRVAPCSFRRASDHPPRVGRPRRGKSLIQQLAEGDAQVKAQSAAIRSDAGGLKGRRRCQVSEDSARRHAASFPGGRPRTQTEPLTWRFVLLDEGRGLTWRTTYHPATRTPPDVGLLLAGNALASRAYAPLARASNFVQAHTGSGTLASRSRSRAGAQVRPGCASTSGAASPVAGWWIPATRGATSVDCYIVGSSVGGGGTAEFRSTTGAAVTGLSALPAAVGLVGPSR